MGRLIRNLITALAWRVFLWGIGMTTAEYLASLDQTYSVMKLCPTCGHEMTLICWTCEESEP